tara:strand:+ start:8361 stop:8621 length:261 start_codon:yes stop_codon:yes gene_type:complete
METHNHQQTLQTKLATLPEKDFQQAHLLASRLEEVKFEMNFGIQKGVYNPNFKSLTKEGKQLVRGINKILKQYNCRVETPQILKFY